MNAHILGILIVVFLPGVLLLLGATVSLWRAHGAFFLWCTRFAPLQARLVEILQLLHPAESVLKPTRSETERDAAAADHVTRACGGPDPIAPHDPFLQA
jgi:hypothetical protein